MNTLELSENMLFQSDKFFINRNKEEIVIPEAKPALARRAA